jgi:hypothetical protein
LKETFSAEDVLGRVETKEEAVALFREEFGEGLQPFYGEVLPFVDEDCIVFRYVPLAMAALRMEPI